MTRLGFVYPGGGAEQEYYLFGEAEGFRVYLAGSRTPGGDTHEIAALLETARHENVIEAGVRLLPLHPDVVLWACTSGSFILGREGAEAQAAALAQATGLPGTSTSLAFVDALAVLGLKRVAVLATYPEPAARAFASFLAAYGVEVAGLAWLDAMSGHDAAAIAPDRLVAALDTPAMGRAEAVLIPDTAMASLHLIERLEAAAGKPVLTANQVTLWAAVGLAGARLKRAEPGRLFDRPYAARRA
jgi:maleate cis-trans isomerase